MCSSGSSPAPAPAALASLARMRGHTSWQAHSTESMLGGCLKLPIIMKWRRSSNAGQGCWAGGLAGTAVPTVQLLLLPLLPLLPRLPIAAAGSVGGAYGEGGVKKGASTSFCSGMP